MNDKELTQLITALSSSAGVSGCESETADLCLEKLKKYTTDCRIKNGNVFAEFGERSDSKPHLLLDAHLDRVGMIVTDITDDGFLCCAPCGGLDRRILPAQKVTVHTESGDIDGVIAVIPPHLSSGKDNTAPSWDDIYIDIGMTSDKTPVQRGDTVSFYCKSAALLGDRICGSALDDRCSVAALIYAIDLISRENIDFSELPFSITLMLSTQEELGERGACIGCYDVNPDYAIAVDVSFALSKGEKPSKCGKLSEGCMIGISPSLDRGMSDWFISHCKEKSIPYQIEVMNGTTGTNADRFSVTRNGVKTVTLSIPLRYMHTPAEVISLSDVKNTAELIAAFVKEGMENGR